MNNNRLTKAVFEADYRKNSKNWSSRLLSILNDHGCSHYFDEKTAIILTELKDLLEEQYKIKWRHTVESKPKLRTYVQVKDCFKTEDYVKYVNNRRERSIMAQFRCGILPLELETGRYRNVLVEERFCFNCETLVESEEHFALFCPLYNEIRQILINEITPSHTTFGNLDNIQKLKVLLNIFWKKTSKFLNKAWTIRNSAVCQN